MDMKWSQEAVVEKGLDFQYMPNSTGESPHIFFQGYVAALWGIMVVIRDSYLWQGACHSSLMHWDGQKTCFHLVNTIAHNFG